VALARLSNISKGAVISAVAIATTTTLSQDIKPTASNIQHINYSKVVIPETIMPFRIRIENIGIEGYTRSNAPGIGVQVIGFSNYII